MTHCSQQLQHFVDQQMLNCVSFENDTRNFVSFRLCCICMNFPQSPYIVSKESLLSAIYEFLNYLGQFSCFDLVSSYHQNQATVVQVISHVGNCLGITVFVRCHFTGVE